MNRRFQRQHPTIEGTVTLRKTYLVIGTDVTASVADSFSELLHKRVYFQLVSSDQTDAVTGDLRCSPKAELNWNSSSARTYVVGDTKHKITFHWPSGYGTPGALLVTNKHAREFFLKELLLNHVPGKGDIHFRCDSWIYPKFMAKLRSNFTAERVFFANNSYLPDDTPKGLVRLRKEELLRLRGDGEGKRKKGNCIYDYDVYNDLGDPDSNKELERKVLGGSQEFPYPRRCRTGRRPTETSPAFESRKLGVITDSFYIPGDEEPALESLSDFRAHSVRGFARRLQGRIENEFGTLMEVKSLYSQGIPGLTGEAFKIMEKILPFQVTKELLNTDDQAILNFPIPTIIKQDDAAWKTDEEFARQTLSGVNPMAIQCLQSFPPWSNLNPQIYGPKESSITAQHILKYLGGISVEEAIKSKKLFILDYYDAFMPYVELINKHPARKIYATRTIFLLAEGTLKPVAIELCLPPTSLGSDSRRVCTPNGNDGGKDQEWLWQLAKAHVRANDSGYHQLVNHWLRTHAAVEPFIIATHRNLSKLHPLHKLLLPHFRNTMHINRNARQSLINAGGVVEECFNSGKYSMEISAKAYKDWRFNEQGLPADLLKRGMAVRDPTDKESGLRLVIKDYPYAVDGLEIWGALKSWLSDYTSLYYKDDQTVQKDTEVQAWWKEIVEVGHGDKKQDERGWYKMKSVEDVKESITTLIWIASAHHAAVNFGQYGYGGFMPNHPSTTRRLIPEEGSREYSEFLIDPEAYFFKTLSDPETATRTMTVLEILSKHPSDEIYLGQGSVDEWTDDRRVETAFQPFRRKLHDIEHKIEARNADTNLKNRCGPAKIPYTLLYPSTSDDSKKGGLTFRGIPNSISI